MADEDLSIAAPAVETPSVPAVEPVETEVLETPEVPQDVEAESTEEEAPAGEPEDEDDELDFAFKKYRVPKSLKTAVEAMRADYTQKTQSTAETAKALEAREAAIAQQAQASDDELNARATIKHVKSEMERFDAFDFAAYQAARQTDPMGADEAWAYKQHLKEQHAALEGTITKAASERTDKAQQNLAKRVQETLEAATKIPGVTAENRTATIDKLVEFAHSQNIPEQVLKDNWSPTFLNLLHQAQIGSQLIAKQSAARPAAPKAPIAPLTVVKASTAPAASRSLADLANGDDMGAYAEARAAGKKR